MIMTVKGEIQREELGIVAMGEYILYGLPGWEHDPRAVFDRPAAFAALKSALLDFKKAGGGTLVDCSGTLLGRDAEFLSTLSAETGVRIVGSSGFCQQDAIPGHFLRAAKTGGANYLSEMFYNELVKGMPVMGMRRTGIKAGVLTAAGGWDQTVQIEELSLRGAALAAKRAGVSVIMTGSVNRAAEQLKMLSEEGLEPDRIVIGHCDDGRAVDPARDREFAGQGYYVAYDHIGWEDSDCPHALADARRVELVKAMVEAGFAERLILSCSARGYAIGTYQPKHSFSYLLMDFVPKLRAAGVKQEALDTILRENPKRILGTKM